MQAMHHNSPPKPSKAFLAMAVLVTVIMIGQVHPIICILGALSCALLMLNYSGQRNPILRKIHGILYRKINLNIIKYLTLVIGLVIVAIMSSTGALLTATVSFVYLCLICKWLELHKPIDYQLAINFGFFCAAMLLLSEQNIGTTLQVWAVLALTLYNFHSIQHDPKLCNLQNEGTTVIPNHFAKPPIRSTLLNILLALPIVVLLYAFFPRIDPLWQFNISNHQARTGIPEQLQMGAIQELSENPATAFTMLWPSNKPPKSAELYYRVYTLGKFDGVYWQQSPTNYNSQGAFAALQQSLTNTAQQNPVSKYTITLEPNFNQWLPLLEFSKPSMPLANIELKNDLTASTATPNSTVITYQASMLDPNEAQRLMQNDQADYTALPSNLNPKTIALANRLLNQADGDHARYIEQVLNWYKANNFVYTLSPPKLLGSDLLDEFLFTSRQGFCEHYASTFTALMRMGGIPSRVVIGYQGGLQVYGKNGSLYTVRQLDAHAWSEVRLADKGWQRIDPTFYIAPLRIDAGMETLTDIPGFFGNGVAGQYSYRKLALRKRLMQIKTQTDLLWQKHVVGYDRSRQESTLFKRLNIQSLGQLLWYLVMVVGGAFASILGWIYWRSRKQWHSLDRALWQIAKYSPAPFDTSQAVSTWLGTISQHTNNALLKQKIAQWGNQYNRLRYSDNNVHPNEQLRSFKKLTQETVTLLKQEKMN